MRALGHADVLLREPTGMALVGELYELGGPPSSEQLERIARAWRSFRTWAFVLVRSASSRLVTASS